MVKKIDISGQRFGRLVAIASAGRDSTGKTLWTCVCDCGEQSVATALNLKSGNTKSCGCGKHKRGADNPRTITDPRRIQERKRTLYAHRAWRADVLKRDKRCLACGTTAELHAHHLHGYADRPDLRVAPNNGAALCHQCHMAFHVKYGRRTGFTEADFCEFVIGIKEAPPALDDLVADEAKTMLTLMRQNLHEAAHYLQKLIEQERA